MKKSAGILPYKKVNEELYVYLEHPGGPYYQDVEKYSICKGEYSNEKALEAAVREFKEESGFDLKNNNFKYLGSHKVSNKKLAIIFITKVDLDPTKMKSNTFKKDFGDGILKEFPEMDKANWFKIEEAKKYIVESQIYFINKIDYLKKKGEI